MLPCRSRHGAHYYVKGGGTKIGLPYYFFLMNMVVYFAPPECDGVLKFLCGNEMNAVYDLAPLKYTRRSPQLQIFRRIDGSFTRCLRDGR